MYKLSVIDNDKLPFLKYIASGEKKAEGRVSSEFVRNLKIGEKLLLFSGTKFVICNIKYLYFYDSCEDMLDTEGLENMVPFVDTNEQALKIYRNAEHLNKTRETKSGFLLRKILSSTSK